MRWIGARWRIGFGGLVGVGIGLLLAGCGAARPVARAEATPRLPFVDVAETAGVEVTIRGSRGDRTNILDTIGYGVAVIDFDRDERPDLVFTGPNRVEAYRNLGGFRFERVELGFRQAGRWGGCAVADVDNNGWPDLYLAGYGCAALYLNQGGRFTEVTDAWGLTPLRGAYPSWGTSAGFADIDSDGWVDLVLCRYVEFDDRSPQRCNSIRPGITSVCPPKIYVPQRPRLYRNVGGRRFEDATQAWRFHGHGAALGVAFQDLDDDGRLDVAIANDERPGDLFVNEGGRFAELGADSGTAYDSLGRVHGGMGIDWGDVDLDRRPDLTVLTFFGEDKCLYRNLGERQFEEASNRWGIAGPMRTDISFGARLFDYDNDGRLDLFVANGHIQENAERIRPEEQYAEPLRLFRNTGASFEPVGDGLWPTLVGRALATADFDNDGGLDVVVTNLEGRALLLWNVAARGHWLGLRLEGRRANRLGLGARVEVEMGGELRRYELHTAGSYMAANDSRLLIGLGERTTIDRLVIHWPGGGSQRVPSPGIDRWTTIREETP